MDKKTMIIVDRDGPAHQRILWHVSSLILALPVYLVSTLFSLDQRLWFPCKFNEVTGMPCPACGFTRSFLWMGHGEYRRAFVTSPLAATLFLGVIFFIAVNVAALLLNVRITPGPFFHWEKKGWTVFLIGCLSVLIADWFYRCASGLG